MAKRRTFRLHRWFKHETLRVAIDDTVAPKKGPHAVGRGAAPMAPVSASMTSTDVYIAKKP